jgi:hypothetical protein
MRLNSAGAKTNAGAFPMDIRRDALAGFAVIVSGLINTSSHLGRPAVTTVSRVIVEGNFLANHAGSKSYRLKFSLLDIPIRPATASTRCMNISPATMLRIWVETLKAPHAHRSCRP